MVRGRPVSWRGSPDYAGAPCAAARTSGNRGQQVDGAGLTAEGRDAGTRSPHGGPFVVHRSSSVPRSLSHLRETVRKPPIHEVVQLPVEYWRKNKKQ